MSSLENSALAFKTLIENERKELSQLNLIRREKQLETEIKQNESGDYMQHIEGYFNKNKEEMKEFLERMEHDELTWTTQMKQFTAHVAPPPPKPTVELNSPSDNPFKKLNDHPDESHQDVKLDAEHGNVLPINNKPNSDILIANSASVENTPISHERLDKDAAAAVDQLHASLAGLSMPKAPKKDEEDDFLLSMQLPPVAQTAPQQ